MYHEYRIIKKKYIEHYEGGLQNFNIRSQSYDLYPSIKRIYDNSKSLKSFKSNKLFINYELDSKGYINRNIITYKYYYSIFNITQYYTSDILYKNIIKPTNYLALEKYIKLYVYKSFKLPMINIKYIMKGITRDKIISNIHYGLVRNKYNKNCYKLYVLLILKFMYELDKNLLSE